MSSTNSESNLAYLMILTLSAKKEIILICPLFVRSSVSLTLKSSDILNIIIHQLVDGRRCSYAISNVAVKLSENGTICLTT